MVSQSSYDFITYIFFVHQITNALADQQTLMTPLRAVTSGKLRLQVFVLSAVVRGKKRVLPFAGDIR